MTDPWKSIRRSFPDECFARDDILDFVGRNPGCRSSHIRESLGIDGAGLFSVLFQLHREGSLVSERGCLFVPQSSEGTISTAQAVTDGLRGSA